MQDRQDQSDLLAARLATGSSGLAFALAAIGGFFVNYGIAIGFTVGAIFCFIAANLFHVLANMRFRRPFTTESKQQRGYWDVFKLISYASIGVSLIFSIILGGAFYIHDLREKITTTQTGRHLTDDQRAKMQIALRTSASEKYSFQVNSSPNCDECEQFAEELRDFFNTIPGWEAGGGPLFFAGEPHRRGLSLVLRSDEQDSVPIDKIYRAFSNAGIPLATETEDLQKGTFVVVVGRVGR